MRSQPSNVPWSLKLGILGLALSVSPLFMGITEAGNNQPADKAIAAKARRDACLWPAGAGAAGPEKNQVGGKTLELGAARRPPDRGSGAARRGRRQCHLYAAR